MHAARRLWTTLEPLHAVAYFAPDVRAAGKGIGLKGYWDTYFAFRAAPLGAVSAPAVVGIFAVFAPEMVARSLPSAWSRASVAGCLAARTAFGAEVLRGIGVSAEDCATAVPLLSSVVLESTGRALGTANAALPLPEDPIQAVFQLATTLREHRGDGHVIALAAAGLTGLEAMHLQLARNRFPSEGMREIRGWTVEQWAETNASLVARGLLSPDGLTPGGAALLDSVEEMTDSLAWQGGLSSVPVDDVVSALAPAVAAVWMSGVLPSLNPVGVPRT
jgi:helix-turn-helix protein